MIELKCPTNTLPLFANVAHGNTEEGLETIGILCGKKVDNKYVVTHLLFPDQRNARLHCELSPLGIEQVSKTQKEHDIIVLGWIHTHPTSDVFMSSTDVHVQYERQRLLPEAVAIVINPQHKDGARFGIYNLTTDGLSLLSKCTLSGQHDHDFLTRYYKNASHCALVDQQLILVALSTSLQIETLNNIPSTPWIYVRQTPVQLDSAAAEHPAPQLKQPSAHAEQKPNKRPLTAHQAKLIPAGHKRHATSAPSHPAHQAKLIPQQQATSAPSHPAAAASDLPAAQLTNEQYAQRAEQREKLKTVQQLVGLCGQYITIEEHCSVALGTCINLRNHVIQLENSLIGAITGDLTTGVCYVATFLVENRFLYTRWFDSGDLQGFVKSHQSFIPEGNNCPAAEYKIKWEVMTTTDFKRRSEWYQSHLCDKRKAITGSGKYLKVTGKRWERLVGQDSCGNKKSVHNSLQQLNSVDTQQAKIQLLGTIVHIGKKSHQLTLNPDSYPGYHMQNGIYESSDLNSKLHHHRLFGTPTPPSSFSDYVTALRSVPDMSLSLYQQQAVVNSLDNDTSPNGRSSGGHSCHLSTGDAPSVGYRTLLKHMPSSTRNRTLYHWRLGNREQFQQMLDTICGKIISLKTSATAETRNDTCTEESNNGYVSMSVAEDQSPAFPELPKETSSFTSSPYVLFLEQLVVGEYGILEWRVNSNKSGQICDIIAMNDIDLISGMFSKNSFVHVERMATGDEVMYSCECKMYSTIQRQNNTLPLDSPPQCLHIRFVAEYIEPRYSMLFPATCNQTGDFPILTKLKKSVEKCNCAVVKLGSSKRYAKYSVVSSDKASCSIVTLEQDRFTCHNGTCRAGKCHRRKVSELGDGNKCQHLVALEANDELWRDLVDEELYNQQNTDDDDDDAHSEVDAEAEAAVEAIIDANMEAEPAEADVDAEPESSPKIEEHFNQETGLWNFPSVSTHVPRQQTDPVLKERSLQRQALNSLNTDVCVNNDGYLMSKNGTGARPFILCPRLEIDLRCKCGDQYWSKAYPYGIVSPCYSQPTNVYLQHGIAKFMIYDRKCLQKQDKCTISYSGHQDALHILSSKTAGGDEIGWEYVNLVMRSQISITAFCAHMSQQYSMKSCKLPFMSRSVFTEFIFSWLANFNIDLRQSSVKLPALQIGPNTQEQFNSYVQRLKCSGRSMNRSHLTFYLEFFIHQWNKMKAKTAQDKKRMTHVLLQR